MEDHQNQNKLNEKPVIICLTAMKNEGWILDRYLSCVSTWADHIILLDQNSEDNSCEIAANYEKVILKHNDTQEFNDYNHWNTLMNESRKINAARKIIIAIDCDEFLTGNTFESAEWNHFVYHAKPGSLMVCNRLMVSTDFDSYFKEPDFLIGFVDDGVSSISQLDDKRSVHNIRLPYPANNPDLYNMKRIKLLHYNVVDFNRFLSKMRWYQCFEVTLKDKSLLTIMDQYFVEGTFDEFWGKRKTKPIPSLELWFSHYESKGIDMTSIVSKSSYWWDYRIVEYFSAHGTAPFSILPIWTVNWATIASSMGVKILISRSVISKLLGRLYLKAKRDNSKFLKSVIKLIPSYHRQGL